MRFLLDTSVLVAALVGSHTQHAAARPLLRSIASGEHSGYVSTHSLAETYAVLTRLPIKPPIHPSEATQMLDRDVFACCEPVELASDEYQSVLHKAAQRGWRGGAIYDALLLQCAVKTQPDRIYTFNVRDFKRLAPELADRICSP